MLLSRLWVGMLTRDAQGAGTNSQITLMINAGGVDRLDHTFAGTSQKDLQRAQANVYEIDIQGQGIDTRELTDSSIRVGITGDDAWCPEHIVVWGENVTALFGTQVVPVAMRTDITTCLSIASDEGPPSLSLRLVGRGGGAMRIQRLLMLMVTGGTADDDSAFTDPNPSFGTSNPLQIQVFSRTGLAVLFAIANTKQNDLNSGVANFYTAPVIVPFSRQDLDDDAITLRILGTDNWHPASFFLFGLETSAGRPSFLVPLVHLPSWPFGVMAADSTTGAASIQLPLLPLGVTVGDDPVVVALQTISSGQERIVALLERLVARSRESEG